MTTPIFTPVLPAKPSTYVDVSDGLYHRPGQRDPEHSGWLRSRLDDAQRIAEPCPACFPERKDGSMSETTLERLERAEDALREIAKKEGPFAMDRLTHAENTIDAMAEIAEDYFKESVGGKA